MTAHGCFLCLSGCSNTQLKHILTEQGQGAVSLLDVNHYAGPLRMFDINCCGIHIVCRSFCAILENMFIQRFWYIDIMRRLCQIHCSHPCQFFCGTDFQCNVGILLTIQDCLLCSYLPSLLYICLHCWLCAHKSIHSWECVFFFIVAVSIHRTSFLVFK